MKYFLAFVLAIFLAFGAVGANAFTPPNPRFLQYVASDPVPVQISATGQALYTVKDEVSNGVNWRYLTQYALDTGSSYQHSYGNEESYFRVAESTSNPDVVQRFTTQSVMDSWGCGDTGVIGCALYVWKPVSVIYNAARMVGWSNNSIAAVIQHESQHDFTGANDQYRIATFTCTGNPDTLMDCGGAAQWLQEYDKQTILAALTPDSPKVTGITKNSIGVTVTWSYDRRDNGYASAFTDLRNATRTAFFFWKQGQQPVWAGSVCGSTFNFCYTFPTDGYRFFDTYWTNQFDCVGVRMENPSVWYIPQSSELGLSGSTPTGFITLSGCWR